MWGKVIGNARITGLILLYVGSFHLEVGYSDKTSDSAGSEIVLVHKPPNDIWPWPISYIRVVPINRFHASSTSLHTLMRTLLPIWKVPNYTALYLSSSMNMWFQDISRFLFMFIAEIYSRASYEHIDLFRRIYTNIHKSKHNSYILFPKIDPPKWSFKTDLIIPTHVWLKTYF